MIDIIGLDHIVLRTAQYHTMIDFYCQILGCQIERVLPEELAMTQLRAGAALIDIVDINGSLGQQGGGAPTPTERNLDHFCLQIRPFEEQKLLDYLDQHQVQHGEYEVRNGAQGFGHSLYIKDPDGNTVELKAQLPQTETNAPNDPEDRTSC